MKLNDLKGRRFGRLLVIDRADDYVSPAGIRMVKWKCLCDCGKNVEVIARNLISGESQSCGCRFSDLKKQNAKWQGTSYEPLYGVWRAMINRCNNPRNKSYCNYGKRGIKVCQEWNGDYLKFRAWAIENGYQKGLSIDRIDVNGNYEPSNCRWTSTDVQSINKRSTDYITYKGETRSLIEWARILGIKYKTLRGRLYAQKMTVDDAFTMPVMNRRVTNE